LTLDPRCHRHRTSLKAHGIEFSPKTHACNALRAGEWRLAGDNLQQLTLQFPAVLSGPVTVSIEFGYPLRDALSGFYRSTFTGQEK